MKTRKLLIFLLCFVVLTASLVIVASAAGASTTTSYKEVTNANGTVTTKYGTIPKDYADKEEYPFVVFEYKNGTLISNGVVGRKTLGTAFNTAKSHNDDNTWDPVNKVYTGNVYSSKIIMRRHYTTLKGKVQDEPSGDQFDNYAQLMGEVILDLNGFTLTQGEGTTGIFYQVTNKAWGTPEYPNTGGRGVFETKYTVINGNIAVDKSPVFRGNMWNCIYYDNNGIGVSALYDAEGNHISTAEIVEYESNKFYFIDTAKKDAEGNYVRITEAYNSTEGINGTKYDLTTVHRTDVDLANKDFIWNFDNVSFGFAEGATTTNMLMMYTNPQASLISKPTSVAPYYFNYNNCTFDLTNAPAGKSVTLFNADPYNGESVTESTVKKWLKITVNVANSMIKASAAHTSALKLYALSQAEYNYGSSVTFAKDGNGNFLQLTLLNGDALPTAPNTSYVNIDDKEYYWHSVSNKYVLSECNLIGETHARCVCGIKQECSDGNGDNICDTEGCGAEYFQEQWIPSAELVPFILLDANGNFTAYYQTFGGATAVAKKNDGYTVLVRRDYSFLPNDDTNLKNAKGSFTIDLQDFVLTRIYDGPYLFDNWCDASTTKDTVNVTVKNGTLNAERWLICLSGNTAMANN